MKSSFFYLLFFFLMTVWPATVNAYTERNLLQHKISEEQVESFLVTQQKWVDYPSYADREGWDRLLGKNKDVIIANGEKQLGYVWKVVTATDYLEFERSGNRTVMESPFDSNNYAIVQLLLAELAEGKGRFMNQLINGIFHTCEMTSWALSAHLPRQPSHRSLPAYDYDMIDLTAGDLGNILSWAYYFMHDEFDKIDPEIAKRLYHELDKRIMQPYLKDDSFWWLAADYKEGDMINNWNPWCNSNALMTFMLLENDRQRLAAAVWRSIQSVDKFLNYVHSDGACEEGPSYWGHASGKVLDYLVLLSDITGNRINFFSDTQIRNMANYVSNSYIGNGWVVNFADASAKGGGNAHLIYRFGKAIDDAQLEQFASYLNKNQQNSISLVSRDFFRILEALKVDRELMECIPAHSTSKFVWYPETQFCYLKKGNVFFAAKGGYNDESHNHNDIGTFSLWINNMPVFLDAGVGTYTKQTFSSERYSIWTMQSNYHNLPVINGVPQAYGRKYEAAEVTASSDEFKLNLKDAYPENAKIEEWIRCYKLKKNQLVIKDKFRLEDAVAPNQVNFMTWGDVAIQDGEVKIARQDVSVSIKFNPDEFDVTKETITLTDPKLSDVWGEKIFRISFTAKRLVKEGEYRFMVNY